MSEGGTYVVVAELGLTKNGYGAEIRHSVPLALPAAQALLGSVLNGAEPDFYQLPAGAMVLAMASGEQYLVIEDRALQPKKLSRFTLAQVRTMPRQLWASLTWDRGVELAEHRRFTIATDVAVYFCDPRSPWQRGSNENTNGLLRQYFPKWTDLSGYSQADLDAVAARLNARPRKTLEYQTPAAMLAAIVASTP